MVLVLKAQKTQPRPVDQAPTAGLKGLLSASPYSRPQTNVFPYTTSWLATTPSPLNTPVH